MSDMTSLSHEYAATSDFARQFNDAVLRLKKWQFAEAGIPLPSAEEVQEARQELVQALKDVVGRLEAKGEAMHSFGIAIPPEVADRLIGKHAETAWLTSFRTFATPRAILRAKGRLTCRRWPPWMRFAMLPMRPLPPPSVVCGGDNGITAPSVAARCRAAVLLFDLRA